MSLIINSLSKEYSGHRVLDETSFTIGERELVGLIGENGSGKTTLLKIIADFEAADSGSVRISAGTTIGYVPQVPEVTEDPCIRTFIAGSLNLQPEEIYKVDLALGELDMEGLAERKLSELSSGQKNKVYLSRMLVNSPDLLLLDEPTNHLDLESLVWLEEHLSKYDGSALIVSHDRRFLDNLVGKIIELDGGKIKTYGGNYSFYRQQRQIERDAQTRKFEEQQKNIKRMEEQVAKRKEKIQQIEKSDRPTRDRDKFAASFFANRGSKKLAKAALSLETRMEKMEKIDRPEPDLSLSAIFRPKQESSKTVLYLKAVSKSLGGNILFENINLVVERGERVALSGPNGSGKTTLLNIIIGKSLPDGGLIELGKNVMIGYLPQDHKEIDSPGMLIEYLVDQLALDKTSAYKLARRFLFTDDNLRTPVENLSSGQKSRLALASIMASGANFLILDEPTNHLDIPAREALESAIASYEGTVLVVSHDRYFLDMINPDKIISL